MAEYKEVLKKDEMENGEMRGISVDGKDILLAKVEDRFYATVNSCAHMGARLSGGTLSGTVLTCPRHHSRYDLSDGHVIRWTDWTGAKLAIAKLFKPPRPLRTYPVKVEGDSVMVEV